MQKATDFSMRQIIVFDTVLTILRDYFTFLHEKGMTATL